jgi:hypothetical protein
MTGRIGSSIRSAETRDDLPNSPRGFIVSSHTQQSSTALREQIGKFIGLLVKRLQVSRAGLGPVRRDIDLSL